MLLSDLSSENSTLRKELQKKSDTIVSLNKKTKDQAEFTIVVEGKNHIRVIFVGGYEVERQW